MEDKGKKPLIGFKLLTDDKKLLEFSEKAKESEVEPDKDRDYPEKARD